LTFFFVPSVLVPGVLVQGVAISGPGGFRLSRESSAATRPRTVSPLVSYGWRVLAGKLWLSVLTMFRERVCELTCLALSL